MNWIEKADKFWAGLLIGLVFPFVIFFFYWAFCHHQLNFPSGFYRYLINGYLLSSVIKMCGLGNLILFYVGIRKKLDHFNKGIIVSVILYVALVAYVSYYLEPELL